MSQTSKIYPVPLDILLSCVISLCLNKQNKKDEKVGGRNKWREEGNKFSGCVQANGRAKVKGR